MATFPVHIDFDPKVRFVTEEKRPGWPAFASPQIEKANETVKTKADALDAAKKGGNADAIAMAQGECRPRSKFAASLSMVTG